MDLLGIIWKGLRFLGMIKWTYRLNPFGLIVVTWRLLFRKK